MAIEEPTATVTPFTTVDVGALVAVTPGVIAGRTIVVPGAMT
jgi:hypothetical protein